MKLIGNMVLIIGGFVGIGFELVKCLLEFGNEVIICGCSEVWFIEVKQQFINIYIK